jgi:hypothetical protein
MDSPLDDFRKYSSFFQKAAGPDADLKLPPTKGEDRSTLRIDDLR